MLVMMLKFSPGLVLWVKRLLEQRTQSESSGYGEPYLVFDPAADMALVILSSESQVLLQIFRAVFIQGMNGCLESSPANCSCLEQFANKHTLNFLRTSPPEPPPDSFDNPYH